MATQARQSHYITKNKEAVISNQEIVGKSWRFDALFKILSYLLYGVFFGVLPATFKITNDSAVDQNPIVISSIVGLLAIAIFSIAIVYWMFKGDVKHHLPLVYSIAHLINALTLSVGVLLTTILYPNQADLTSRVFLTMVYFGAWAVVMPLVMIGLLFTSRKKFPLSWSKAPFAFFSWIILALVQVMIYLSQSAISDGKADERTLFLAISLVVFVLAALVFLFSIIYIHRFRDVLLDERAEFEIQSIHDWESAKVLSIVSAAVASMTYLVVLLWDQAVEFAHFALFIDLVLNAIIVVAYIAIVVYIKTVNVQNKQKLYRISKFFKSIDNTLLLEMFVWFIIVKSALIQGVLINDNDLITNDYVLMTLISFASITLLYVVTTIGSLNIPNIRNVASSSFVIVFSVISVIFTIVFNTALDGGAQYAPKWLTLVMLLITLIGISISLIIKISTISKIFKASNSAPTTKIEPQLASIKEFENDDEATTEYQMNINETKDVDLNEKANVNATKGGN